MQNARSDGMKIADIVKKLNVSAFTVYKYTLAPKKMRTIRSPRNRKGKTPGDNAPRDHLRSGPYVSVLADLRAKRNAIDSAIATIEALG